MSLNDENRRLRVNDEMEKSYDINPLAKEMIDTISSMVKDN